MTREELIHHIRYSIDIGADITLTNEDGEEIIKALEQEPCEDCISREDALMCMTVEYVADMIYKPEDIISKHIQRLKALPPVIPQQKTGHWILADEQNKEDTENDNYRFICSECGCSDIHAKGTIVPYCWKCGTKMEVEL